MNTRKQRKSTRAERRWEYFAWQMDAAPTAQARLVVVMTLLRAVLADADEDDASRVAERVSQYLLETARNVRPRSSR